MNDELYLYEPYPLNAPGPFYVMNDACLQCEAPEAEAPDLVSRAWIGPRNTPCYFKRQPKNSRELERATSAVIVACCGAVRYKGRDPEVLKRLIAANRSSECDALPEAIAERLAQPAAVRPVAHAPDRSHPMYDGELDS